MTDKTIKGDCSVSLIRENEDGSADYQFDFPPEALDALTRLGILTAINAGIAEAEHLNPAEKKMPTRERNFCPRCGKRLTSGFVEISIHTCTPPMEKQ